MYDPYLVDDKVDEFAHKLEETAVSPEDRATFFAELSNSIDACGAEPGVFVRRLVRRLEVSPRLRPQRKAYLSQELLKHI